MAQWRVIPAEEARQIARRVRDRSRPLLFEDPDKAEETLAALAPEDFEFGREEGFCLDDLASIRRVGVARHELVELVSRLVPLLDAYVAWPGVGGSGYQRAFEAQVETLRLEQVLQQIVKELAVPEARSALEEEIADHTGQASYSAAQEVAHKAVADIKALPFELDYQFADHQGPDPTGTFVYSAVLDLAATMVDRGCHVHNVVALISECLHGEYGYGSGE